MATACIILLSSYPRRKEAENKHIVQLKDPKAPIIHLDSGTEVAAVSEERSALQCSQ